MESDSDEKTRLRSGDGTSYSVNYEKAAKRARSLQQTLRDITSGPERLWVVFLFSLIAVIGSSLMGLALGYSSASILDFTELKLNASELQYDLAKGIGQQGIFGVSHSSI